jgi:hypothetical protein
MNESFDIGSIVKYNEDPVFINLLPTLKSLAITFFKHIDLFIQISRQHTYDDGDSSIVFNTLMCLNNVSTMYQNELSAEEFNAFITTFNAVVSIKRELRGIVQGLSPIDTCWKLCHYFIVPIRISTDDFPKTLKEKILKKWISVSFVMPFIPKFNERFASSVYYTEEYTRFYDAISIDKSKMDMIKSRFVDAFFDTVITLKNGTEKNLSAVFLRTHMHLMLLSSIEIMKHFVPNINECLKINPNWIPNLITRYDKMQNGHFEALLKFTDYFKFEKK